MSTLLDFVLPAILNVTIALSAGGQSVEQEWRVSLSEATAMLAANDYAAAEEILNRTIELARTIGADSRQMAVTLERVALVHARAGRLLQSERCYRRIISIYEKVPGVEKLAIAAVLNNLATIYIETFRLEEAESLLRRSLAVRPDAAADPDLVLLRTYEHLFAIAFMRRNLKAAEPLSQTIVELSERLVGLDDPETGLAWAYRGVLEVELGRYPSGIAHLERALSLSEHSVTRDHPNSVRMIAALGWAQKKAGRPDKAAPLLKEALESLHPPFGPESAWTASVLTIYADVLQRLNRKAEARQVRARANEISEKFRRDNQIGFTIDAGALH